MNRPDREIRAVFTKDAIRVYQAYSDAIADAALTHGTFVSPPFGMNRMTWIKPSFLWMMYRAGWGYKDQGQKRILAVDISREGFAWALEHSCPSTPPAGMDRTEWQRLKERSPVRVQWDPERDMHFNPLPHRSVQIGLSGEAVERYVRQWILAISDVTGLAHEVKALIDAGKTDEALSLLPKESPYPFAPAG